LLNYPCSTHQVVIGVIFYRIHNKNDKAQEDTSSQGSFVDATKAQDDSIEDTTQKQ